MAVILFSCRLTRTIKLMEYSFSTAMLWVSLQNIITLRFYVLSNIHVFNFLFGFVTDTDLVPSSTLTYRTIGGILDFYIFTGPTPDLAVQQYTDVIGKPVMPPYWSLGFHLCRYGYGNVLTLKSVIRRMRAGEFPYVSEKFQIRFDLLLNANSLVQACP